MIVVKRTNAEDKHFQEFVRELDLDLKIRDGQEHVFYAQYNRIDKIKYVVIAYEDDQALGCGAIKEYATDTMEVKRMYVPVSKRGKGIASIIVKELENWSRELGYKKCVLETGKKQPEAIKLYMKNKYKIISNYGQYVGMENSICFEKDLTI